MTIDTYKIILTSGVLKMASEDDIAAIFEALDRLCNNCSDEITSIHGEHHGLIAAIDKKSKTIRALKDKIELNALYKIDELELEITNAIQNKQKTDGEQI